MADEQALKKDSIGFVGLVFQSLTSIAPLMDMIALMTVTALFALASMPLAFLLAFVLSFLTTNTIFQFSKKIASSGGYYSFVGNGLGSRSGLFAGWIYLSYNALVVPNVAIFFGALLVPATFELVTGTALPAFLWIVLSLVLIAFVSGMAYWGIRPSLKYSVVTGIIEVAIMIVFSTVVIVTSGSANTLQVFTPTIAHGGGLSGVALGMIFSITSFAGSGSSVTLGEEARLPHRTIGRAIIVSVVISGTAILLAAYALTIGWGTSGMSGFGLQLIPGIIESKTYLGWAGALIVVIFGINSFMNLGLSYFNAGIRSMHAMARDGVILPRKLAAVNEKRGTPHFAIITETAIAIALSVPIALWIGPLDAFLIELAAVTTGYLIVHILANISLGIFFRKIGELSILKHIIIPASSTAVFLLTLYYSIGYNSFPIDYGVVAVFLWAVVGAIYVSTRKEEKVKGAALHNALHSEPQL